MKELQRLLRKYNVYIVNTDTFIKAFTHTSYAFENNLGLKGHNERLEFLGDAVLELIISKYLFDFTTEITEGEMTRLRAQIVCEQSLVKAAKRLNFGNYLLLGKGEEKTGGRNKASILADVFEAFVGALYLEVGFEKCYDIVVDILHEEINEAFIKGETDYKTQLQEYIQKNGVNKLTYKVIKETGPDHDKEFTTSVYLNGKLIGTGIGKSKKLSEQSAAQKALEKFFGGDKLR
ncbi:ribonuclease III [Anaerobranca gottschalkii]|uniref:Ribonuclease 3 n=1 Tax=Anaerobranca gottschalkii DSM 13577 TaxID=1120990 RepID=A0A1I0BG66_9FIRM|nr:ribonuclease III [Anaerobranca gottschalkii]SET05943.1 ribonuclease-3 [Anaerobranca gottschalkii DSM 13577]